LIILNHNNINLIRKVIKKYKIDMNASKTYYFEFDFFEKISIREKQLKIIKEACE